MARQVVVKASEGHRAFGRLLKQVYRSEDHMVVERDGFPVAVLLSYQEYEKMRRRQAIDAFDRLNHELGRAVQAEGMSDEELLAEVEKAQQEAYERAYGRPQR